MKEIIKYESVDGSIFDDKENCIENDNLVSKISDIMNNLNNVPDFDHNKSTDFCNGKYYIQQNKNTFDYVRIELLKIAKDKIDHKWIAQSIENPDNFHLSWIGRLLGDSMYRPLYKAWCRLMQMDKEYKEWGQPYYANNPNSDAKEFKR